MNNSYFLPSNIPQRYERSDVVFSVSQHIALLVIQNLKNHMKGRALQSHETACQPRAFPSVSLAINERQPICVQMRDFNV